jgi:NAD(P)-dependent dehydrogenase (short-subunit alcohol dehydrogenase family)
MSTLDVSQLLRPGLLDGVSVVVAGAAACGADRGGGGEPRDSLGAGIRAACAQLGASVSEIELGGESAGGVEQDLAAQPLEQSLERLLADASSIELLAVDGAGLFAAQAVAAPGDGTAALLACLDASWNVTRAVVNGAFLPDARGGRIVYLAPAPDGGEHAGAARAALENLARTLSIEWARYGISTVTIAPGASTAAAEVGALSAYLASPAGAYFSGCLLDLTAMQRT